MQHHLMAPNDKKTNNAPQFKWAKIFKIEFLLHGIAGGLVGYFILHPAAMITPYLFPYKGTFPFLQIIQASFSVKHLDMGTYFAALGFFIGMAQGLYAHKLIDLRHVAERLSTTQALILAYNRLWGYDPDLGRDRNYKKQWPESFQSEQMLKGKPASPGLARGLTAYYNQDKNFVLLFQKPFDNTNALLRFEQAVKQTVTQLNALQEQARRKSTVDAASIFDAHQAMLADKAFVKPIKNLIRQGEYAPRAILTVTSQYIDRFTKIKNPYIREKIQDVKDIVLRIMRNLMDSNPEQTGFSGRIVIAKELLPSDLLKICAEDAKGIIIIQGGITGHVSILARSLQIPLVIADSPYLLDQPDGLNVLLDAITGDICVNPTDRAISSFEEKIRLSSLEIESIGKGLSGSCRTKDGTPIDLMGNINLLTDLKALEIPFCRGIGLYRTEFSFLDHSTFPSEEAQYAIYKKVAERGAGKIITFRTMDLGGDKCFFRSGSSEDMNPLLGIKSIRFSLRHQDLFVQQIRAILRACINDPCRILLPMISSIDEFLAAKRVILQSEQQLVEEKIPHATDVLVGVLIETPSVVDIIDELAMAADFLSLGTNDFVQYMLAVDRTNAELADYYVPFHPSVLRSIKRIVDGAGRIGKPLSICGDIASEPDYIVFFIGIGVRQFSMEPARLLRAQKIISEIDVNDAEKTAGTLLKQSKVIETRDLFTRNG